jgi:protein SCO1/2
MYGPAPSDRKSVLPPPSYTREIGIDQKLNNQVPMDVPFLDETGVTVTLAKFAKQNRPIILAPVYYECPSVCTLTLNAITKTVNVLQLQTGRDYEVAVLSIAPNETPELAARKKLSYMNELKSPDAPGSWHFLTGNEENIRAVTESVGFRYFWDEKTQTYAHAAGIIILTPEGRVSRYLFGTNYTPLDLRLALTEASSGRIGGLAEQVLLLCFQYDPAMGRYSTAVLNLVRIGGLFTLVIVGAFIYLSVRREKRPAVAGAPAAASARSSLLRPDSDLSHVPPAPDHEKVS